VVVVVVVVVEVEEEVDAVVGCAAKWPAVGGEVDNSMCEPPTIKILNVVAIPIWCNMTSRSD